MSTLIGCVKIKMKAIQHYLNSLRLLEYINLIFLVSYKYYIKLLLLNDNNLPEGPKMAKRDLKQEFLF